MSSTVAACRGVERTYFTKSGRVDALRGVDVDVPAGRMTVLMGPSGSGKSTLLRIMGGADAPGVGRVEVDGARLHEWSRRRRRRWRRRTVGLVHQRPSENLISYLSAREHLELAGRLRRASVDPGALLDAVGLAHRGDNTPSEMSGGEQQRLAFAQAITGGPAIVLADEPTAELDRGTAVSLIEVIRGLVDRGMSVVVATHDPLVAGAADLVVRLDHGRRVS
ncbi:MAG TPA: ATP-binding cassette domain-containing protein [Actinomycetota bacterium]|jgi:putative ABC transport system ATP-binding protein|nr:ATP-binding cassette domain-containing protein [Actinomycetota bacterium]